jgi:peptidoglycan DL-endopeptidase LytE
MDTRRLPTNLLKLFIAVALLFSVLAFTRPAYAESTCQSPVTAVRGDTLFKIASRCGTTVSALLRANPEIKDRNLIYVGQKIVLPGALLPGTGSTDIYVIKRGDTLTSLARHFNTTIDKLLELNKDITNPSRIYEGQRLVVPKASTPAPTPAPGQTYIVQRGDTLRIIAARFGTTVDELLKLNPNITDPNKIFVGQKLVLPASVEIYTVVRGDTLRKIATRFNTTVQKLLELNPTIKDADIIYVGQVLRIK